MFGKKGKENGFEWKKTILKTYGKIEKYGEKFDNIEKTQQEIKTTHKEHCEKEEKDWVGFKNVICRKIDEAKCPEAQTIASIKTNGRVKGDEIKNLTTSVTEFKESVDKVLLKAEGEKIAWRKMWSRIGYGLAGVSTITGIVTKIMGLW